MSDQLSSAMLAKLKELNAPPGAPQPVDAVDKADERLNTEKSDTARAMRVGLWALGIGFGGFLLWAGLAPLDEGVPSPAMVTIDTKRKPVQHQTGGIIKEVLVGEGTVVKAGQTLIRLDDAVAEATHQASRQRYLALRAMEGRLLAEQANRSSIEFHKDLLEAAKSDPVIARHVQNQEQLFLTRKAAVAADQQSMAESIQGQEGLLKSYASMLEGRATQLRLLNEELANTRGLVSDGYAPRNRQFELERQVADSTMAIADLRGNTIRAQSTIAEIRQRMLARRQDFRREVETALADVSRDVQAEEARYIATGNELRRTEIKAPADGQVMGLAFQTPGSVIAPGYKIMDIVPADAPLLLEARILPQMIDRIQTGQSVDIRFAAFAHTPQLVVRGTVTSVSRDLLSDDANHMTYYLARVSVTPEGLKTLGAQRLQPGMGAEVIFKTGERSMLTYLLHPLTKRLAASMKEE
jgi:protease secretion system membrane fusion protein